MLKTKIKLLLLTFIFSTQFSFISYSMNEENENNSLPTRQTNYGKRCRYFNGNPNSCRYGNNCRFYHSEVSRQEKGNLEKYSVRHQASYFKEKMDLVGEMPEDLKNFKINYEDNSDEYKQKLERLNRYYRKIDYVFNDNPSSDYTYSHSDNTRLQQPGKGLFKQNTVLRNGWEKPKTPGRNGGSDDMEDKIARLEEKSIPNPEGYNKNEFLKWCRTYGKNPDNECPNWRFLE